MIFTLFLVNWNNRVHQPDINYLWPGAVTVVGNAIEGHGVESVTRLFTECLFFYLYIHMENRLRIIYVSKIN